MKITKIQTETVEVCPFCEQENVYPNWDVDPDDERQSKCDWCENSGYCTLNEIL